MTENHTVTAYDDELRLLDRRIAQMGGVVEGNLGRAYDALEKRDPRLAAVVVENDRVVDAAQIEIEDQVISMIARRQPMAIDLRHIMGALKIAAELERIGDLAKNIAKRALAISSEPYPRPMISGLNHMVERALRQLKDVLDAYAERNADLALEVWRADEQIDNVYNSVFRELLTYMMEDPRYIGLCTHLLFGAKNVERIGDHATNIAEIIYFQVHGKSITDERPKSDKTSMTLISPVEEGPDPRKSGKTG